MFSIVIPARYASTRLPGKPLLDIAGKPMIQHVYERAIASSADEVIVATDDQRVLEAVQDFGGEVVLTRADHPSGTDRLNEVALQRGYASDHILVNVQGDEPLIPVAVIEQVASNMVRSETAGIATLCEAITTVDDLLDPNAVKVVRDCHNMALYFSRAPIPFPRDAVDPAAIPAAGQLHEPALEGYMREHAATVGWFRHIGLYAYRCSVLKDFVKWPLAAIEYGEKLEQLRALYNGVNIHCAEAVEPVPAGVDTAQDLARVGALFKKV